MPTGEVLSYLANDNPIVKDILNWRQSNCKTLMWTLYQTRSPVAFTDYMQTVAATGRLSSNNPNLQNIPIRNRRGANKKSVCGKRRELYLVSADYLPNWIAYHCSIERRKHDKAFQIMKTFINLLLQSIWCSTEEVTREQRSHKTGILIIYGVSFGL
jgi:DNA polymerase-1